jgi:hypothetical protein
MYFDICQNDSQTYETVCAELWPLFDDEPWERMKKDKELMYHAVSLSTRKEQYFAKAVTFATMCLEAFIYDYAAHYFSDTYVKRYIDKLDLISKWVLVPKLAIGRDFTRDSKAFEYLVKLAKFRNELVHAKSKPLPRHDPDSNEFMKEVVPMLKKDIGRDHYMSDISPYKMILEIFTELRKLESDDIATQWWQLEEGGYPWEDIK